MSALVERRNSSRQPHYTCKSFGAWFYWADDLSYPERALQRYFITIVDKNELIPSKFKSMKQVHKFLQEHIPDLFLDPVSLLSGLEFDHRYKTATRDFDTDF